MGAFFHFFVVLLQHHNRKSMWMIVLLLLPLLGMLYIGWHVWLLVPLSPWWRAGLLLVGLLSFLMLFLNLGRFVDRMPMWLARMVYDVGNSSLTLVKILMIDQIHNIFLTIQKNLITSEFAQIEITCFCPSRNAIINVVVTLYKGVNT